MMQVKDLPTLKDCINKAATVGQSCDIAVLLDCPLASQVPVRQYHTSLLLCKGVEDTQSTHGALARSFAGVVCVCVCIPFFYCGM